MSELLQEYVDSGSQRLRVDRDAGVIRGVKLLGLASRNGRRYRENALVEAVALYEGAKVNINHPKGHPLAPRDYQDRLGMVRGVQFRPGEGLFGDLHFNPRHALSEQLVWDAEHAPQNVGMSHNVLARTKQNGNETVVEAITKVQSIDLVADPATTNGLYEQADTCAASVAPASDGAADESGDFTLESITLEALRRQRPELICEIEKPLEIELTKLRCQLNEFISREAIQRRRDLISRLLQEHNLPLPPSSGNEKSGLVGERFLEMLTHAADETEIRALIEERVALLQDATRRAGSRPKSKSQVALATGPTVTPVRSAAEFAAAVRN